MKKFLLVLWLAVLATQANAQSAIATAAFIMALSNSGSQGQDQAATTEVPKESDGFIVVSKENWSTNAVDAEHQGELRYCPEKFVTLGQARCRYVKEGFWNRLLNIKEDVPSIPFREYLKSVMPKNSEVIAVQEAKHGDLRVYYRYMQDQQ